VNLVPARSVMEEGMGCRACASDHLQEFAGEISANFPGVERSNLAPVYVSQRFLICLDCGFAELKVQQPELEKLRKGMATGRSQSA
jgi:hypothetical protein